MIAGRCPFARSLMSNRRCWEILVGQNGNRGVLEPIVKTGNASTIAVVNGIKQLLPRAKQTIPPELKIQSLADQSVFVKAAISGVIREAVIAACLTALMILLFFGSWRSTVIIAISIPLSILTSVIVLSSHSRARGTAATRGNEIGRGVATDINESVH